MRWGGGGDGKITPCLKRVRILLETWNLVRKYTYIYILRNIPFSTKIPLILLMSASVLSSLVNGQNFMSISLLVLELWQFSLIKDWPEIWKSEIPPSEFYPISGVWAKLWEPNLARKSPIKCYWMLKNAKLHHLPFLSY